MKKLVVFAVFSVILNAVAAPQLQLFPAQRSKAPIIGGAIVERPDATVLLFKLKPETPESFKLNSIYIFLDDNADNVAGAEAVGMEAVRFVDAAQAEAELKARFGIEL